MDTTRWHLFFFLSSCRVCRRCSSRQRTRQKPPQFFCFFGFLSTTRSRTHRRRKELLPQLQNLGYLKKSMVSEGIYRIIKGMMKKLLIADLINKFIVKLPFETPETIVRLNCGSPYTPIPYKSITISPPIPILPLGLHYCLAFDYPENFYRPYKATSVAEFWRRWHRTLSDWIRDYIYLSTWWVTRTSNMESVSKYYGNAYHYWSWHGASWNFVIYGCLHGTAVSINRWQRKSEPVEKQECLSPTLLHGFGVSF